ncbi:MAG: proteasome-associated ATPase [Fimbriimonadaceae bacterium]|jgi:proteasome-associated ATPase|nr:proteasome-associated ATPase [Fimbriimonadaceae bacterium]
MPSEETSRTLELLDKVIEHAPKSDARLQNYLSALRSAVESDAKGQEEAKRVLAEYEEAYAKLTAPANRLGVFLEWLKADEKLALIALGDQEFVANVDPKVNHEELTTGTRVKVNDAYAVVGAMPAALGGGIQKVGETYEDGRIRVGSDVPGAEGRVVSRAEILKETLIQAGDEIRIDPTGKLALEHFAKQESRDYFLEHVPELPWEKVGGQEEAIRLIRDTIEQPLLYPEIFEKFEKKPIKGMLLYGPPGCGKTLIGKATAYNLTREYSKRVGHEVKEYFMAISGPKILNMWLGETERMVREIFKTAREKAKEGRLVFIFMDEAESVLRTRSSGRWLNISNTVVPQFCAELDGLVALENVVLMLTSNRPDYIDPAVLRPERIDRKVKISRPDKMATLQILGIYLHDRIPLDPPMVKKYDGEIDCARRELIEGVAEHIWRKSKETEFLRVFLRDGSSETLYFKDLVSGALLKSIVDRAKDYAIKRAIAAPKKEQGVSLDDLIQAADQEYKENEIFPKSDVQEDWLQLLDFAPENVASVKPIGRNRGQEISRKSVI